MIRRCSLFIFALKSEGSHTISLLLFLSNLWNLFFFSRHINIFWLSGITLWQIGFVVLWCCTTLDAVIDEVIFLMMIDKIRVWAVLGKLTFNMIPLVALLAFNPFLAVCNMGVGIEVDLFAVVTILIFVEGSSANAAEPNKRSAFLA